MSVSTLHSRPRVTAVRRVVVSALLTVFLAAGCKSPLDTSVAGGGVVKTVTSGQDWSASNKAEPTINAKGKQSAPAQSAIASSSVTKLAFVPGSSTKVFASAITQGLFYSSNGAETWTQVLSKFNVFDFVIDPTNEEHIYVAGQSTAHARVLESKDGGKSWQEVFNDAVSQNSARSIALNPNDVRQVLVGLNSGDLLLSQDGGQTWSLIQNFQDSVQQISWPTPTLLYVLTRVKGLYVSRDAGRTLENISKPLIDLGVWRKNLPTEPPLPSGDQTEIVKSDLPSSAVQTFYRLAVHTQDPTKIYVSADNGVFSNSDGGRLWSYLRLPLRRTENSAVRAVALGDQNRALYVGVANTVYKSTNEGQAWQVTAIATDAVINYILVDFNVPSVAYIGLTGTRY
ncbi:MAG: hypothetical protein JNK33_03770 [Candidatus Doudnabacteria bacterium]|nr:hypothetical protein [Candidatus Doudnabacteria bacterium]